VSGKELGFYIRPEYNRSFYFSSDISAVAGMEFNERYTIRGGVSLGNDINETGVKVFSGAEAALSFDIPLFAGFSWRYYGLPDYETHSHALLPLVSLKWRRAGISIGTNMRFTSFFNEAPVFESMLSFLIYFNIVNNNKLQLGLRWANFSDFAADNMGAYFLGFYSFFKLNECVSLVNEIEVLQSGSVGLSSNLYGIAYRGGVSFSW
jgi:hypothetical protein